MNNRASEMLLLVAATLCMSIGSSSCNGEMKLIDDGVYFAQSGEDRISVRNGKIQFVLVTPESGRASSLDKMYDYTVLADGRIRPYRMRSADAVLGIGRFDWYWDGEQIIQQDPKTDKEVNLFSRKSSYPLPKLEPREEAEHL